MARAATSATLSTQEMTKRIGASQVASVATALERQARTLVQLTGPYIGVDVVSLPTWERRLEQGGQALLGRVYTADELRFAGGRLDRLATRLAAKEAVLKVLGTGIRGIALRDVEVRVDARGKPTIRLAGPAARRASRLELDGVAISLCHEGEYAIAIAAGFRSPREIGGTRRRSGTLSRK